MHTGAAEVATGTELAARSCAAFDEIANAVGATKTVVGRITGSVAQMSSGANQVVTVMDEIGRLAYVIANGAMSMTSAANSVARSIESIAAVSEEDSAASQEVSATTEELATQSEETVASVQAMADMTDQLDLVISRFRLDLDAAEAKAQTGQGADAKRPVAMPVKRRASAA